jgi:hypothetical protein
LPHERDTDDSTPLVSGGGLSEEHRLAIFMTKDQGMSNAIRRDHRACIHRIIKWLQEHYPDVADTSICVITIEDRADPRLYFRDADEYDFIYSGLDPQYILGFLADLKNKKKGGKFYSPSHISNFLKQLSGVHWFLTSICPLTFTQRWTSSWPVTRKSLWIKKEGQCG